MNHLLAMVLATSTAATIATGVVGTLAEEREAETGAVRTVAQVQPPMAPHGENCLSDGDLREAVAEKRVIPPLSAIRAAREVVPRAEIQRATLCKREQGLVYLLTALKRDGHFVQVTVDAQSGKVSGP